MSIGADIALSNSDMKKTIYSKYESTNSMVSDTQHSGEWREVVTAHPRLGTPDGSEEGITEDDGIILRFLGLPVGIYAQHPDSRIFMNEDEVEDMEEATGMSFPRFTKWDFHLDRATLTDGPARRERLAQASEDNQKDSETKMMGAMETFFDKMMQKMNNPDDVKSALERKLDDLEPEQIIALKQLQEIDAEDAIQLAAAKLEDA
tara:strand:+ start:6033 stop:6647 length:615 start_codon:yes stop_codon:yes gene_type:complete